MDKRIACGPPAGKIAVAVIDLAFWTLWLRDQSLPLWADAGYEAATGSFVERLGMDGAPQPDVPRRVMVQARQIHAFATAAQNGWHPAGAEMALRAGDTMIARYAVSGADKGWAFSCNRQGAVVDSRRDLYAQAFVLLALAALIQLDPQPRYFALVRQTLGFLDRDMAHPAGGYAESWPNTVLPRRQNPHMHLLEALLALHETGRAGDLTPRIIAMLDLFDRRFFSTTDAVLTEFFDADLAPENPARNFEAGHHFEWVWLLSRAAKLACPPTDATSRALLQSGLRGIDPDGRVVEQTGPLGPTVRSRRLWCSMETVKALSLPAGRAIRPAGVPQVLAAAWHDFTAPAVPGGWIDRINPAGDPLVDHIPASTLYHITTALDFAARQTA